MNQNGSGIMLIQLQFDNYFFRIIEESVEVWLAVSFQANT